MSNYYWALPALQNLKISSIIEVGSRDALDAIFFSKYFNCIVNAFEPDPLNILQCKKNILNCKAQDSIKLHELALSDKSGIADFYSVDSNLYENRGASSFYLINFGNRPRSDPDRARKVVQKKIKIKMARFDELDLLLPDLLLLDVQGSELIVLKGFGEGLRNIKAIILETSFSENYIGASNFHSLHNYLINYGFFFSGTNKSGLISKKLPKRELLSKFFNTFEPDFDCIYLKK